MRISGTEPSSVIISQVENVCPKFPKQGKSKRGGVINPLKNFWHRITDITSFGKRLGSSLGHTLNFFPNLVQYCFRIMYHKESLTLLHYE